MDGLVRVRGRRAFMLGVAVTALLVGLVAMHHLSITVDVAPAPVSASAHMPGTERPAEPADPDHGGSGHDTGLLHLCLAILTAVALLLVSAVVWLCPPPIATPHRSGSSRLRTAPPPTAPARLALLCVLRT